MKQRNNSPMINRRKLQICIVVFISDSISLTLWGTPPLMICQGWLASHWTWQIWGYRLRHGTPTLDASTVDSTATFSMVAPSHQWSASLSGHFTPHQHLSCCLLCGSIPSENCCYSDQEPHHPRAEMMSSFLTFSSGSCSRVCHSKPASAAHTVDRVGERIPDPFHASPQDWPGTVTQTLVGLSFQIPLYLHKLPLARRLSRNPTLTHGCWVEYTEQKVYKGSIFLLPTKISKSLLFCTAA